MGSRDVKIYMEALIFKLTCLLCVPLYCTDWF